MLLPTLLAALLAGATPIPGFDVDHAADDRQLFIRLENATAQLAEKGDLALRRDVRLEQCKRAHTDAVRLSRSDAASPRLEGAELYRRGA